MPEPVIDWTPLPEGWPDPWTWPDPAPAPPESTDIDIFIPVDTQSELRVPGVPCQLCKQIVLAVLVTVIVSSLFTEAT
jgi:hypothetical protein